MATQADILRLRALVDESTTATYTDLALNEMIDAAGSDLEVVATDIWLRKAAAYSGLADVAEGSSRRSLSQLYKQALEMHKHFAGEDGDSSGGDTSVMRPARTRPIERP